MRKPARRSRNMATFPRLREIREREFGWEVLDLVTKVDGKPGIASIYRLEQGAALRLPHVRRVFDVVNVALGKTLDPEKEIKVK